MCVTNFRWLLCTGMLIYPCLGPFPVFPRQWPLSSGCGLTQVVLRGGWFLALFQSRGKSNPDLSSQTLQMTHHQLALCSFPPLDAEDSSASCFFGHGQRHIAAVLRKRSSPRPSRFYRKADGKPVFGSLTPNR